MQPHLTRPSIPVLYFSGNIKAMKTSTTLSENCQFGNYLGTNKSPQLPCPNTFSWGVWGVKETVTHPSSQQQRSNQQASTYSMKATTVPAVLLGQFLLLVLYFKSWDLKSNNDYEIKVQTVSFHLRVFSSISGEPFRNYSSPPILGEQKNWDTCVL